MTGTAGLSGAALLEGRNLAKLRGPRTIFANVSFAVAPGQLLLLAGANGAGKTTLLRIVAGVSRPDAGELSAPDRGRIGYLGHDTFLYPQLPAIENLRFWTALYDRPADDETLLRALAEVGLAAFAEERAGVFSRGMAQRLSLARVFLQKPDLALLDEPFTGLDAASRAMLWRRIETMRAEGAAVVLVSHTAREDVARADLALILNGQKQGGVWFGPAGELPVANLEAASC